MTSKINCICLRIYFTVELTVVKWTKVGDNVNNLVKDFCCTNLYKQWYNTDKLNSKSV